MLRVLFLDMNSYFASVEQQLRPELRGRPVGIVPTVTDSTCCIAASYEAKAFGVKTGTGVGQAKQLCPQLRIVEARPAVYVEHHHAIVAAVEDCLPVHAVHSIDEMSCRLLGREGDPAEARRIAGRIKQTLRERVGAYLRCSIGIAPNRFLAKVAADMQKPDGLVVIDRPELPGRLHGLDLQDLPGINKRMAARLARVGVRSVAELCALDRAQMAAAWQSVVGTVWWHWLRGDDVPDPPTQRRQVGHSHVLPPALRNDPDARAVMIRLLHKAAARMRRLGYWARLLTVRIDFLRQPAWQDQIGLGLCRDTLTILEGFARLWPRKPPHPPYRVGVTLTHLVADASAPLPLFPGEVNRLRLASAMDDLNDRHGPHTIYFAGMFGHQQAAPMRISFTSIPDIERDV